MWLRWLFFSETFLVELRAASMLIGWCATTKITGEANEFINKFIFTSLTQWKRVVFQKTLCSHLFRKFPKFYGSRVFVMVLTKFQNYSPSGNRCVWSTPNHRIFFRSVLFVSTHVVHAVLFVQAFQSDRSIHCYKSKQHFKNSNYLK